MRDGYLGCDVRRVEDNARRVALVGRHVPMPPRCGGRLLEDKQSCQIISEGEKL